MKPGDKFTCSHCGQTAFAKAEKILDGWEVKGEHLVCSFCGKEAGKADTEAAAAGSVQIDPAKSALLDLLGETAPQDGFTLHADEGDKRFCRDCAHAIVNAFAVICTRSMREVQPMDDCAEFEKRPAKKTAAD